jgi:NADH dehydrogenase
MESRSDTRAARVLIVGGGYGGGRLLYHFERLLRGGPKVDVTLVSRDNYALWTPFLFEACTGTIELRHCSVPFRSFLRRTHFVEATVRHIDLERRMVHATGGERSKYALPYDHLVLAAGSETNRVAIPGADNAFTFKFLADAVVLRNHLIERFERAEVETDPLTKQRLLTVVVIGAGLVGVELIGELTCFVDGIVRNYRRVGREEVRFVLLQGGSHILPEIDPPLAKYAERVLGGRVGMTIRTGARVQSIERERVHMAGDETIDAATIVLSAGILPSAVVAHLPVERGRHGEIVVDATMRCPSRPEIWALGDCASIPCRDGTPYPTLAQFALREADVLARNIIAVLSGGTPKPFVYHAKGFMGSLGHRKAFARVFGIRVRGFLAWWIRRTYYLSRIPGWARRLHIVIDWTFALFFRPDIVKVDAVTEGKLLLREGAIGGISDAAEQMPEAMAHPRHQPAEAPGRELGGQVHSP